MMAGARGITQGVRVATLAELVVDEMTGTGPGHCARVNYLDRSEAETICRYVRDHPVTDGTKFSAFILTGARSSDANSLIISTDRAIELRNRKQERLCLFVPSDLVDATISSLGNSFAEIDGRVLQQNAMNRVLNGLTPRAQEVIRLIRAELRYSSGVSDEEQFGLVLAAAEHEQDGQLDTLGLELWRVGLIADGRPDFELHLPANRRNMRLLVRPQRLDAPYRDRIASLKVTAETSRQLEQFFARRPMHDVRRWSQEIAEGIGPTFDQWDFPETVRTNLVSVRLRPFTDVSGEVTKQSKLMQPDGAGGTLLAPCGEKSVITVQWDTEPLRPINVHAWQVSLLPAGEDGDVDDDTGLDLPSREVKGTSRTGRLKLDLEFNEPPEIPYWVRVVAIDESGNEVVSDEDGEAIAATSDTFYLTGEQPASHAGNGQRRRTVSNLAEGRLRAAVESKDEEIILTQPALNDTYFTARANERTLLNVALSPFLLALERRTINMPRLGGRWALDLDEVGGAPPEPQDAPPILSQDGAWADFWRSRKTFFDRLGQDVVRNIIEAAEWTAELTNASLRYAQAYTALLNNLPTEELRDALSVDTLLVRLHRFDQIEESVVVLPTHPLRAAWFASHAALLRKWEDRILQHDGKGRRGLVDLDLVRDLRPSNMPAFVHGWTNDKPFVFFQNLAFFHGVALPADSPDPLRRYRELGQVLGFGSEPIESDDRRPEQLARHLHDFLTIHPYADPVQVVLVNPDQGEFIADSLERLPRLSAGELGADEEEVPTSPAFEITAYVLDEQQTGLTALDRLQTRQHERRTRYGTDHLQPGLATSVLPLAAISEDRLRSAHVAAVFDLSQPSVSALREPVADRGIGSISLYGLIARFSSEFSAGADATNWRYRVALPGMKTEGHPAGQRFGETLIELQDSLQRATGRLLNPQWDDEAVPGLEVTLDHDRVRLLERLHSESDWVVTLDRFFGVDYYDSPNDDVLGDVARKYLIDYSPEFTEGLGHRMIVTTAWREEVAMVLRRAMEDLGFASIDSSVGRLLHYLKTVSGRLALRALRPESTGTEAVSLGVVMAWLQARGRLNQGVLVPVDAHLGLFGPTSAGAIEQGQRRCDLVLFGLRRGIVDASFIEVKWRRGPLGNIDGLVQDMDIQMRMTGSALEERFFNPDRVDGALQRAYLANVLRFYCARSRRYGLLEPAAATTFLSYLGQFEKAGLNFRPSYEGYVVSLDDPGRRPFVQDDLSITVLTARDFEETIADFLPVTPIDTTRALDTGNLGERAVSASATNGRSAVDHEISVPNSQRGSEIPADELLDASDKDTESEAQPEPQSRQQSEPTVVLGDSTSGEVIWRPSVKGSPHLFITGIPGQGKSWTILRLLTEFHRQGVPSLSFDFHGQLGDSSNHYVHVAQPVVIDASSGLPFSPFECSSDASAAGWNATAYAVSEIFGYVCGLGEIQRDTLFTCIRDAYRAYGFGPGDGSADEPSEYPSLDDVRRRIERAETQKRAHNLIARCRPLLEMDIFRPPAGGRNNFMDAVRQGLVIDLHRLGSETLQLAAGAFLLRKIYRDMFLWGQADRLRLAIVLDEAHRLAHDLTLPKIMKEGRKYGVAAVVASQGLADFHPDVLGTSGTKIAFRTNFPDSRKVAGFFRARPGYDLAATLERLGVGEALVQTPEMQTAAKTTMRPPD